MKFFNKKKTEEEEKETSKESVTAETKNNEKHQDEKGSVTGKFSFGLKKDKQETSQLQKEPNVDKQEDVKKIEPENAVAPAEDDKKSYSSLEKSIPSAEKIKKLIEIVTNSNENSIKPVFNFEKNRITYPILVEIGENEENMDFLEKLASNSANILEREIYEKLLVCPQHPGDLSVSIRMYCPDCSSMDIRILHLIEHKVCGYIAEKEEYGVVSVEDVKTCPNCKRQIKDYKKEIRLPGKWSKCNSCNKKFDNPVIKLHCRRFDHDFELNDVESLTVPCYKIKADAGENVNVLTLVPQLRKVITALGFAVEELSTVKGKSGVSHQTNIFAHNNENKTIAVFIKTAKDIVDDAEVNSTLINVLDIGPTCTVFIGIPAVTERARAMAATHKMIIVTGKDINKITEEVRKKLSEEIAISHLNT